MDQADKEKIIEKVNANNLLCSLKLGDRVISKKTGYPAVGTVTGILSSITFFGANDLGIGMSLTDGTFAVFSDRGEEFRLWTVLYPDWMFNPVIYIDFDKPQKNMTEEDIRTAYPDLSDDEVIETLERAVITNKAIYPIEDLELFE